jgi:ribosome-associated protein
MMSEARQELSPAQTAHKIADLIVEKKGTELLVLDIGECSDIADYMILASGTNKRQVQAMTEEISKDMKQCGHPAIGISGKTHGWWVLMDYGDVLVHVMQEDARRYYDLEALWADAQIVRRGVEDAA